MARRRDPARAEPARLLVRLHRAGDSGCDDGHLDLPVAAPGRRQPAHGGAGAAAGDGVAGLGGEELVLRRAAGSVHVRHHDCVAPGDLLQPVLQRLSDQPGGGPGRPRHRVRSDGHGGSAPDRGGPLHRVRRLAGVPALSAACRSDADAGDRAGLGPRPRPLP